MASLLFLVLYNSSGAGLSLKALDYQGGAYKIEITHLLSHKSKTVWTSREKLTETLSNEFLANDGTEFLTFLWDDLDMGDRENHIEIDDDLTSFEVAEFIVQDFHDFLTAQMWFDDSTSVNKALRRLLLGDDYSDVVVSV